MKTIEELLTEQNKILDDLFSKMNYSNAPFASLLMSELHSYEDMDGNDRLFCIDFIFDVPYAHLSPMLKGAVSGYWTEHTEETYEALRIDPGHLSVISFENYRDSVPHEFLKRQIDSYIQGYHRVLSSQD